MCAAPACGPSLPSTRCVFFCLKLQRGTRGVSNAEEMQTHQREHTQLHPRKGSGQILQNSSSCGRRRSLRSRRQTNGMRTARLAIRTSRSVCRTENLIQQGRTGPQRFCTKEYDTQRGRRVNSHHGRRAAGRNGRTTRCSPQELLCGGGLLG